MTCLDNVFLRRGVNFSDQLFLRATPIHDSIFHWKLLQLTVNLK